MDTGATTDSDLLINALNQASHPNIANRDPENDELLAYIDALSDMMFLDQPTPTTEINNGNAMVSLSSDEVDETEETDEPMLLFELE